MAKSFSSAEWRKIHDLLKRRGHAFGLPARRRGSVVVGSFNVRKMGAVGNKSAGTWDMLTTIVKHFDLLAIQEVQDDLEGLDFIRDRLGGGYGMAVSDITGGYPGMRPAPERLAFLYRRKAVARTEVASDITYDRASVVSTLFGAREEFWVAFETYARDLADYQAEKARRKAAGKKGPSKPVPHLPEFVTFIRQPHCVSFRVAGAPGAAPYEFLAVNAHLLYGAYKDERYKEFQALVGWLVDRARNARRMYHPNVILLGDCNLDFKNPETTRNRIDTYIKSRNSHDLKRKPARINFPFLDVHPRRSKVFRTNARLSQTYDQIGLVVHDKRLPGHKANATAGATPDGFDYGVFDFVGLFSQALHGKPFADLTKAQGKALVGKFEHDFTDHMPIWIRLAKPS